MKETVTDLLGQHMREVARLKAALSRIRSIARGGAADEFEDDDAAVAEIAKLADEALRAAKEA